MALVEFLVDVSRVSGHPRLTIRGNDYSNWPITCFWVFSRGIIQEEGQGVVGGHLFIRVKSGTAVLAFCLRNKQGAMF